MEPVPAVRVIALIASYNEQRFIRNCLEHLFSQGVEVYLIDNESTDTTVQIAREYLGNGLAGLETLPYDGVFRWGQILDRKEELADKLEADWFIQMGVDEIRSAPPGMGTLAEAFSQVEAEGSTAVNFQEYTFIPTREAPDHDHDRFLTTMRWYYPFSPAEPYHVEAWKKPARPAEFAWSGGHFVRFDGLHVYPHNFILKHYQFLCLSHAQAKWGKRRFPSAEVERGWHGWRASFDASRVRLPSAADLRVYTVDKQLDASLPRSHHLVDPQ